MIVYFSGPEGAGKTAMMTRYNRIHHLMGGECWSFPGYELLNERGRVVSRLVYPEEIMGLLDDIQYIVLSIDEISNFLNHHNWYSKLTDIITYGAAAQRRKREFCIMATGPLFEWLPHDLKQMFHEVVHCSDMHWKNHNIPRGQRIQFYREDRRGVLSGRVGTFTKPQVFYPSYYYKYYETFSLVDPKYQNYKYNIKKEVIYLDAEGNRIEKEPGRQYDDRYLELARKIEELKVQKNLLLRPRELHSLLTSIGLTATRGVNRFLHARGMYFDNIQKGYVIEKS